MSKLKKKKTEQRNEIAFLLNKVQQYKGMLSSPKLNDEEKKQLRLLRKELNECKQKQESNE